MRTLSRVMRGVLAALLLAGCLVTGSATATAAQPDCAGRGVPDSKISIQLWTFAEYIGFGTDQATIDRTREVFAALSEIGYRNVEPFTLSGLSAEEYRALLDEYGLKASARHVNAARRRARSTSRRSSTRTPPSGSSTSARAAPRTTRPRRSGSRMPSTSTSSAPWPASRASP